MRIDDDHMYHGAALIQIAEDPRFTAINALRIGHETIRSGYRINDSVVVYLKYAQKPSPSHQEYQFAFHAVHLQILARIGTANPRTFIALVCVKDREVCCLTYAELQGLIGRRRAAFGMDESTYTVLVTAPANSKLRAYVNAPGKKNMILGNVMKVGRNRFPDAIFD